MDVENDLSARSVQELFPALLGTMIHKLMEMLVSSGNSIDIVSAIGGFIHEYRTSLCNCGRNEKGLCKGSGK